MLERAPNMSDIVRAEALVRPHLWNTDPRRSLALSDRFQADIVLKPENLQRLGSFKIRGAFNRVHELARAGAKAVITASAGNHAQGVAYAASALGLSATIVVPATASPAKIDALGRMGAVPRLIGATYDEAEDAAYALAEEEQLPFVSPYDRAVIAGQGTVGYELLCAAPDLDLLLVPVGAGGLLAGCLIAAKTINPAITVIGVQSEAAPAMAAALRAGRIVHVECSDSLADGLSGNIARGELPFSIIRRMVDDLLLVEEDAIAAAMRLLLADERWAVEGAGAVGVAAMLAGKLDIRGRRVGVVVSGGNVAYATLKAVMAGTNDDERLG